MLKTVDDGVFGKLTYKHSWFKEDEIVFFGRTQKIKIKVKAYENDEILQTQRDNYQKCKDFIGHNKDEIHSKLQRYCTDFYETDENIESILEIQSIYFARDGSWAILFESKYDIENGLAILFKDSDMIVDSQDILL
ncbi:MAG: DUF6985 domain-containing protein [Wolinella sp.]